MLHYIAQIKIIKLWEFFKFFKMEIRERIIENATRLFMARGCKSLTMDDISTENGISKRTLYEMFKDKSALLEACIDNIARKRKDYFVNMSNSSENVIDFLLKIHNFEADYMDNTSNVFLEEIKRFYPEVYEKSFLGMRDEHLKYTKYLIVEGRKEGVFIDKIGDVDLESQVLTTFVKGPSSWASDMNNTQCSRRLYFYSTIVIFLRGLSTPKGIKIIDDFFADKNIN